MLPILASPTISPVKHERRTVTRILEYQAIQYRAERLGCVHTIHYFSNDGSNKFRKFERMPTLTTEDIWLLSVFSHAGVIAPKVDTVAKFISNPVLALSTQTWHEHRGISNGTSTALALVNTTCRQLV